MARSFGRHIYNGIITQGDAHKEQVNSIDKFNKLNASTKPRKKSNGRY